MFNPRTKTYLADAMKRWAKSLVKDGIGSLDKEMVHVEYVESAESNLRCMVRVQDDGVNEGPRYYSITLREVT
jgi:hypothetical protein